MLAQNLIVALTLAMPFASALNIRDMNSVIPSGSGADKRDRKTWKPTETVYGKCNGGSCSVKWPGKWFANNENCKVGACWKQRGGGDGKRCHLEIVYPEKASPETTIFCPPIVS